MKGILSVFACLMLGVGVQAATYYASPNGSRTAAGTRQAPWAVGNSLSPDRLTDLKGGDELVLLPGEYRAPVVLPERPGATSYVTIRADVPRTVTITASGQHAGITTTAAGANWIRLSGLDFAVFRGLAQTGPLNHLEVIDCRFTSGCVRGVQLGGPGVDWTFRQVTHEQVPQGMLLGAKGSTAAIVGVVVEDCASIDCNHPDLTNTDGMVAEANVTNMTVRNCVAQGSRDSGFDLKANNLRVENCVGANNGANGFKVWGTDAVVSNCLATGNGDTGFVLANSYEQLRWCTAISNGKYSVRPQGVDNATVEITACILVGPLRNGYNDTIPVFSYCLFKPRAETALLYQGRTFALLYRDAAAWDHLGKGSRMGDPALGTDYKPMAGSQALTMGPDGGAIGYGGSLTAPASPEKDEVAKLYRYQVQVSTDNGLTWSAPEVVATVTSADTPTVRIEPN